MVACDVCVYGLGGGQISSSGIVVGVGAFRSLFFGASCGRARRRPADRPAGGGWTAI